MKSKEKTQNRPKWRGLVLLLTSFLGLFAGLCTVFVLVVTSAQAWQEHANAQWPEATAQVQRCDLDHYTHNPEWYRIDCSVSYRVREEEIVSRVYSPSTPGRRRFLWQSPPHQLETLQEWVDKHPTGTPIAVHYDPASHRSAVLVVTDMPFRWTSYAGQLEAAGSRSGELRGVSGDRANHAAAILIRVFQQPATY